LDERGGGSPRLISTGRVHLLQLALATGVILRPAQRETEVEPSEVVAGRQVERVAQGVDRASYVSLELARDPEVQPTLRERGSRLDCCESVGLGGTTLPQLEVNLGEGTKRDRIAMPRQRLLVSATRFFEGALAFEEAPQVQVSLPIAGLRAQ